MADSDVDRLLVGKVRHGDSVAWEQVIQRFEGRLLAFVNSRLRNRTASEDVVQESFMGFLISLPNYDDRTPLEAWLFTITAHKLTDYLRREGRRPSIPLFAVTGDDDSARELSGSARRASSLLQSGERKTAETVVIRDCLQQLIQQWLASGDYERLQCLELLFVLGWTNKSVAERLGLSEQTVANHKHFVVTKLKEAAKDARLRSFNLEEFGV